MDDLLLPFSVFGLILLIVLLGMLGMIMLGLLFKSWRRGLGGPKVPDEPTAGAADPWQEAGRRLAAPDSESLEDERGDGNPRGSGDSGGR
ncbi:MAG: hypothetical protein JJU36_03320 [Phycisphaeraceae bacterium]|nr:hypothetical protein [Phycisphaeraceae bacterium]